MSKQPADRTARQPGRPTSYSRVTLSRIMTAVDVNLYGTVHGGVIMKFIDDVAGAVAARHRGGPAVTAAIDEIVFAEPIRVGDLVHAHAQVNWTGNTSLEVGVAVVSERWDTAGAQPVTVATAYLVFVAVDAEGNPQPVPPVLPESPIDARRFQEAGIRRAHRLARRRAIEEHRAAPPTESGPAVEHWPAAEPGPAVEHGTAGAGWKARGDG